MSRQWTQRFLKLEELKILFQGGNRILQKVTLTMDSEIQAEVTAENDSVLPAPSLLTRLNRQNRYVICDTTSVVATWQNDGRGWMIRMASL